MRKFFILSTLLVATSLSANPKKLHIVNSTNEYAPYRIKHPNGTFSGIYHDMIKAVAKKLKIKIKVGHYPWKRCLKMIKNGKADAIIAPFKTPERENFMYFAKEPLAYEENTLFTYKGSNIKFDGDLEKINSLKVGAALGLSYGAEWDNMIFPKKEILRHQIDIVKLLARKKLDIIIGSKLVNIHIAQKLNVADKIIPLKPSLSKSGGHIAFTKKKGEAYKKLAQTFSKEIKKFKNTKKYKKILAKYGLK